MPRQLNIDITEIITGLYITTESTVLGAQFDNNAVELAFSRPERYENDTLRLLFENSSTSFEPQDIGILNKYSIPSALTQLTTLNMQVAFYRNGELLAHSGVVAFTLTSSLKRGAAPVSGSTGTPSSQETDPIFTQYKPLLATVVDLNAETTERKAGDNTIAAELMKKLDIQQSLSDVDKVMTVGSDGKLVPRTPTGGGEEILIPPTKTAVNLVKNSDFSQGSTNWTLSNGQMTSSEGGVITLINTHSTTEAFRIYQSIQGIQLGHVYLVSYSARFSYNFGDEANFRQLVAMLGSVTTAQIIYANNWQTHMSLITAAASGTMSLYVGFRTDTIPYQVGQNTLQIKEVMMYDLTDIFGDNIPSRNWIYHNIPYTSTSIEFSVHDSDYSNCIVLGDSNTAGNANKDTVFPTLMLPPTENGGFGGMRMAFVPSMGETQKYFCAPYLIDALVDNDWSLFETAGIYPTYQYNYDRIRNVDMVNEIRTIVIAFGTNDYGAATSMGSDDPLDMTVTTFKGAIRHCISRVNSAAPRVRLIFMTPPWKWAFKVGSTTEFKDMRTELNSRGLLLKDYVDAIISVCDYYKITVVDLFNEGGVNEFNQTRFLDDGTHAVYDYNVIIANMLDREIL